MTAKPSLDQAAALLRAGGLVAFPTETVYGLGANALDPAAVRRIFEAKGRPSSSPLIVHVATPGMLRKTVVGWPARAETLAKRFWPGPLTLVMPKGQAIPDEVTAGLPTVGVRMPAHPLALELIRRARVPVAAPSANRFTELSPTTAEHVRRSLGDRVDMIVDGGPCKVGIESTVLSLAEDIAIILRPGMVSRQQIESLIGPVRVAAPPDAGSAHTSPGQHSRHYAPRTPLRLGLPDRKDGVAYLWLRQNAEAELAVQMPADPDRYAAMLYDTLYRVDLLGLREIVVEPVPAASEWDGIGDRLARAGRNK